MLSSPRNPGQTLYSGRNTQDRIQQYLLGDLAPCHVVTFETALRENPHLAAQVLALRRQNELLRELRADILDEPVPEQLMATLSGSRCAASKRQFFALRARPAGTRRIAHLRAAASALLTLVTGLASARRRTRP